MIKLIKNIIAILFIMTTTACATPLPGADIYYISFKPDYNYFESGTFKYGNDEEMRLGNIGRGEYDQFHTMHLNFKMKDGREYTESIDITELMQNIIKQDDVFDTRNTKWGGTVQLEFFLKKNSLKIIYEVGEHVKKKSMFYAINHKYLLLEKPLN